MVEFIKIKYLQKYLQKMLFGRNGQFPSAWRIMIKTWRRVLLGGMIKNEQIQFFDSQMYCSNVNTITLKLSTTMVEYPGLGKNSRKILERIVKD